MLKRIMNLNIVFVSLFFFNLYSINAYEYIDSKNEQGVLNSISDIYDMKEQYEDLVGDYEETIINNATSNMYWWPIGSSETREVNGKLYADGNPVESIITSEFGSAEDFRNGKAHGALDITVSGASPNTINIIASKSGEVVYPTNSSQIGYEDNGYYGNKDGGGFGNYVKIKHADGTYTIYAHLAQNSITVMSGNVVEQGQVIGKMGHSGSSTGLHLHFEMRDANDNKIDPAQFVSKDNPRSMASNSSNFSLVTTTLSKAEFNAKMQDYYNRTGNQFFRNNFLSKSDEIYDASIKYGVNPELVVVTAKAESGFKGCGSTNNYWGIGITNGKGCSAGPTFNSMSAGIERYAKVLFEYTDQGKFAKTITDRYNLRHEAGCDPAGHGLPGTFEGMQSLYSWIGNYRWNPGSSGSGGCYYLNIIYGAGYCDSVPTCSATSSTNNCAQNTATTTCEQNDYSAWQIKKKYQIRYDIFGL